MYRDGLCERKFRDRSLQEIADEERSWEFSTTTPGMTPIQALELVRGFAKAIQESTPEAQRESCTTGLPADRDHRRRRLPGLCRGSQQIHGRPADRPLIQKRILPVRWPLQVQ